MTTSSSGYGDANWPHGEYPPSQQGYPPQQGYSSSQYGYAPAQQPPSPQAAGQAAITIDSIKGVGGGTLFGVSDPAGPTVLVNGYSVPAQWGPTVVPVPPGRHHVRMFVPYRLPKEFGRAETTVDVAAGQNVALEYRTPKWTFSRGALGPPPQRARGCGASILAVVGLLFVVVIITVIAMALGG